MITVIATELGTIHTEPRNQFLLGVSSQGSSLVKLVNILQSPRTFSCPCYRSVASLDPRLKG